MLNLRPVDDKFYLSGGWTDVPEDGKWLKLNNFRAVLDLQFTPDDYTARSFQYIKDELQDLSIEYFAVPMTDGENYDLDYTFRATSNQLEFWDGQFTERRDKILVKCGVGVSRSVAVLIDYFCKRDRLTYTEAKIRVSKPDRFFSMLPVGIHPDLEWYLRNRYPDLSAFGEAI